MTSLYQAGVSIREEENVEAARAFYPQLGEGGAARAVRLSEKEEEIVSLFSEIADVLRASPVHVQQRKTSRSQLETALLHARAYFQGEGKDSGRDSKKRSLWSTADPWLIPEMLPRELRPRKAVNRSRVNGTSAHKRTVEDLSEGVHGVLQEASDVQEGLVLTGKDGMNEENGEKDDKGEEGEEGEPGEIIEEDDDLELDADYETGFRFDDDDGYEEADSGNEEATF